MNTDFVKSLGELIWRPFDFVDKQVEYYQQRKNMAQAQQIRQAEELFNQEMEQKRQSFYAELDDFIARRGIECGALIAQSIANYRKTMAECTVSIGRSLGEMHMELLDNATVLVRRKQDELKKVQDEAINTAIVQLERISTMENDLGRNILENAVEKTLDGIIDRSNEFMKKIDKEFSDMMKSIHTTTDAAMINAQQYISPTFAKNSMQLQGGETKLLESK